MDVTDIIEAFGGSRRLAVELGAGRTAVCNWHRSGIPKIRCQELAELAKRRGLHMPFTDNHGIRRPGISLETLMLARPRVSMNSDMVSSR
jgi:hypothetical protein